MSRLVPDFHPILTEEIIEALQTKQVFTVLDFIDADTEQIVKIARLTFREVTAVKNSFLKKFAASPINGFDYYKATLRSAAIIPTGIERVDRDLLDGGLLTGNIYEICGSAASGKTQFAMSLIINLIQTLKQKVYYLDTKNDFSGLKVKSMLKAGISKKQETQHLNRIFVKRTYTKWDLINSLYEIKNSLEANLKLRLIVIDSLPAVLLNSNDYAKNNSFINHLVNIMRYIASEYQIVFLITNLITSWNEFDFKNPQEAAMPETILCGKYWLGTPNVRLKIEKDDQISNVFCVSLLESLNLNNKEENTVKIVLSNRGFSDFIK